MAKKPTLLELVEQAQAAASALIEERVAEVKKEFPQIPIDVLRRIEVTRGDSCVCRVARRLLEQQR